MKITFFSSLCSTLPLLLLTGLHSFRLGRCAREARFIFSRFPIRCKPQNGCSGLRRGASVIHPKKRYTVTRGLLYFKSKKKFFNADFFPINDTLLGGESARIKYLMIPLGGFFLRSFVGFTRKEFCKKRKWRFCTNCGNTNRGNYTTLTNYQKVDNIIRRLIFITMKI